MDENEVDLLRRAELYQRLENAFGDLRYFPMELSGQSPVENSIPMRVERVWEHEGQMMLRMEQFPFVDERQDLAYVVIDLRKRQAQAAPGMHNFQGKNLFWAVQTPEAREQSVLGELGSETLGRSLHSGLALMGIPADALDNRYVDERSRFTHFCNLSVNKMLKDIQDVGYKFEGARSPRPLIEDAAKERVVKPEASVAKITGRYAADNQLDFSVSVEKGKEFLMSLSYKTEDALKSAFKELFAAPLEREANRAFGEILAKIPKQKVSPIELNRNPEAKTSRRANPPLKIISRENLDTGQVMRVKLKSGHEVALGIVDASEKDLKQALSPKMRVEMTKTPVDLLPQNRHGSATKVLARIPDLQKPIPNWQQPSPKISAHYSSNNRFDFTASLAGGREVVISVASATRAELREAFDELFAEPMGREANRLFFDEEFDLAQPPRQPRQASPRYPGKRVHPESPSHPTPSHGNQPLKILSREETDSGGQLMRVRLSSGKEVAIEISDTSKEELEQILSPNMQVEIQRTPWTRKPEEQRRLASEQSQQVARNPIDRKHKQIQSR